MSGTPDLRPVSRGMVEALIVTERARLTIRELSERGGLNPGSSHRRPRARRRLVVAPRAWVVGLALRGF